MLNKRTWTAIIILGFLGQLAWGVENQYFNTFLYNNVTPDPRPISWMVAASAITATLASIFMGALSDRVRHRWGRKPFLLIGYVLWGITTALFPTAAFFHPIGLAIFMAILFDCVMTFLGSTANDSVFHAYVADITTVDNRGKVMGVLEILTWVALLFVYGGAGIIIDKFGYFSFFYIVGGMVLILGMISGLLLKEDKTEAPVIKESYWKQVFGTFRFSELKMHKNFIFLLVSITLWGVAQNIFFPYLLIYINHFLKISNTDSSLIIFFAILIGGIGAAYPLGMLVDKWGRKKVAYLAIVAEAIGLFAFSLARSTPILIATGVLWLAPISAWTIATSAWTKDLFPEDKRGQFGGYVIMFSVAFAMVPGPLIGSWLTTAYGVHSVLDGKEAFIPSSLIFQVAAIATLLAAIPIYFVNRKRTQQSSQLPSEN
ncbi:MAG: MFS transporter [Anaerolineaceae bacterium]|nr:MFS transporter [Anaerolineaceae bacterium]